MRPAFSRIRLPFVLALLASSLLLFSSQGSGLVSAQAPYSVKAGDTLLSIAIEIGVSESRLSGWMDEVVLLNSLPSPDALSIGQKLTLPASGSSGSIAPTSVSSGASGGSYTVRAGDTLYDIAAKNAVPESALSSWIDSIQKLNDLASPDTLREGDVLRLPKVAGTANVASGSTPGSTISTTPTTNYTVKSGDTLHDIAAKSGIAEATLTAWIEAVLKLNSLGSADLLQEGGVLKIPSKGPAAQAVSSPPASANVASTATYTVKPGDTLYDIAAKNGVSESINSWIETVLSLNSLASADLLQEGSVLKVPGRAATSASGASTAASQSVTSTIDYTVRSGDTLYDIAAKNGVSEGLASWIDSVLSLNSLESADMLREGAVIKVPTVPGRSSTPEPASPAAAASSSQAPPSNTYTVRAGETFQGIARKLGVPEDVMSIWIDQVVMLSRINRNDPLVDGEVLLVPAAPTSPTTASNNGQSTSAGTSNRKKPTANYTVLAGDTLSDIASKFKVGTTQLSGWFREVLDMNALGSADMIAVGQRLVVPGEEPVQPPVASVPSASATPPTLPSATSAPPLNSATSTPNLTRGPNGTCFYTVLQGETWDIIARKLGVSDSAKAAWIDGISALNGISGHALPVGDAIRMLC
ncbi:MAG TPA: LysM peptidoglycan-binding domain-containing protein [Dehalococcoidia bacterium]|nr:LysM peptidoglycan-binding domain-containing protein [Dehalococcoidia bacterium]